MAEHAEANQEPFAAIESTPNILWNFLGSSEIFSPKTSRTGAMSVCELDDVSMPRVSIGPLGREGLSPRASIKRIFLAVCDLEPNTRWSRLEQLCKGDRALRQEVERLLENDTLDSIFENDLEETTAAKTGLTDEWVGRTVGHFKLEECIGRGAMSVVYRAEDILLKRFVIVKLLETDLVYDERVRQRFRHEAQVAASLDHRSICKVYDVGEIEERPFIVMAYIPGDSLAKVIGHGSLRSSTAVEYAIHIGEGLQAAHLKGILHRDLKPENVLLALSADGSMQPKIIGFGFVQISRATMLTDSGRSLDAARYICPELLRGQPVNQQADIWSLGVMLYEMLAGQPPFDGENRERLVYQICNEEPTPLAAVNPILPKRAERIVAKALKRDKRRRYQNIGSLLRDLRALKQQLNLT